jgi:hypothetical protein
MPAGANQQPTTSELELWIDAASRKRDERFCRVRSDALFDPIARAPRTNGGHAPFGAQRGAVGAAHLEELLMRFASHSQLAFLFVLSLGCAVACGDDDDDSMPPNDSGGPGGSAMSQGGEAGASSEDSQLCKDLGGPSGIDAVVRGDGKTSHTDPFNAFKFDKNGRQASVLLNVATDPCIGQQFASLLTEERAEDLEHLAECLSAFVQNAAGCAVAYDEDKSGRVCRDMKSAHAGRNISEEDYTALILDAATALVAAGVPQDSPQFMAVASALTADDLKRDIITSGSASYSQPGAMCEAASEAGAGSGGTNSAAGSAGMGGSP